MLLLSHRAQLMASGALFALFAGGYGQRAYALPPGCVGPDAQGVITCSGVALTLVGDLTLSSDSLTTADTSTLSTSGVTLASGGGTPPTGNITAGGGISLTGGGTGGTVTAVQDFTDTGVSSASVNIAGDAVTDGAISADSRNGAATVTVGGLADAGLGITTDAGGYGDAATIDITETATAGEGIIARSRGGEAVIIIGGDAAAGTEIATTSGGYGVSSITIGGNAQAGSEIVALTNDYADATVTISGDADAGGDVRAYSRYYDAFVTVGGDATSGDDIRVYSFAGNTSLTIGGDANANNSIRAVSEYGASNLVIGGNATAGDAILAASRNGPLTLSIDGDATASNLIHAAALSGNTYVTIGGDAVTDGDLTTFGSGTSHLTVSGNAEVGGDIDASSQSGQSLIAITGNADAGGQIRAYSQYGASTVEIGGNVTAGNGVAAEARDGAARLIFGGDVASEGGLTTSTVKDDSSISVAGDLSVAGAITVEKDDFFRYYAEGEASLAVGGNADIGENLIVDTGYGKAIVTVGGNLTVEDDIRMGSFLYNAEMAVAGEVTTGAGLRITSIYSSPVVSIGGNVTVGTDINIGASNGGARVNITGNVTATEGIRVSGDGSAATLEIGGDVTVGTDIRTVASRFEDATVIIGGNATTADGIYVNSSSASAIVEVTGDVTATAAVSTAIYAKRSTNNGADIYDDSIVAVSITNATGAITGGSTGIHALTSYGGEININVNNVSAVGENATAAIRVDREGDSEVTLNSTGLIEANAGDGVVINGAFAYGDVTINVVDVDAARVGINVDADTFGDDRFEITSTGLILAGSGNGIDVNAGYFGGADIEVSANDVQAGASGISVSQGPGQRSTINVTGNVIGGHNPDAGRGNGITLFLDTFDVDAGSNFHRINISGSVSSAREDGFALADLGGTTRVTLNEGGVLVGRTSLGSYNDTLTVAGADLTQSGEIDGGIGGYDNILIRENTSLIGANLTGFERLTVASPISLSPGFLLDDDPLFIVEEEPDLTTTTAQIQGADILTLDGDDGQLVVFSGGILSSGDDLTITAARGVDAQDEVLLVRRPELGAGLTSLDCVDPGSCDDTDFRLLTGFETVGLVPGGTLSTGGTPGASRITVNATEAGRGVTGGGTIDMQNGAVEDQVIVNGTVDLASRDGAGDVLRVDIDQTVAEGDILTVRDDLRLSGNIDVNVINIDVTETTVTDHVVARSLTGTAGLADGDDGVLTASTESIAAAVEARFEGKEVVVQVTTDFTPDTENLGRSGLSGNGTVFGEYLNEVLNDPALAEVRANVLGATSIDDLDAIYDQLDGSALSAAAASSAAIGADFAGSLFSCAVGEGQHAAIDEGQCGWTRVGGTFTNQDGSAGNAGSDQTVFSVSAGGQIEVTENLRLGAGVGFAIIDSNSDNGLKLDGNRVSAGLSAKYVDGPFLLGASFGGGITFSDTDRVAGAQIARADFETFDVSALTRAAYLFDAGQGFYLKPQLQAGVTFVHREAFTESGAGGANLAVASSSQTFPHASPTLEIGGNFESGGMTVRPYVRIGAMVLSEDSVETTARFAAAGVTTNFTSSVERDNLFGDLAVGTTVFSGDNISVRAEYQGRISENTTSHGGFLKLQFNF